MSFICQGISCVMDTSGRHHDAIGWVCFMEGMITSEARLIECAYMKQYYFRGMVNNWATGLAMEILECTHGQWLYRNIMVHVHLCRTINTQWKDTPEDKQVAGIM